MRNSACWVQARRAAGSSARHNCTSASKLHSSTESPSGRMGAQYQNRGMGGQTNAGRSRAWSFPHFVNPVTSVALSHSPHCCHLSLTGLRQLPRFRVPTSARIPATLTFCIWSGRHVQLAIQHDNGDLTITPTASQAVTRAWPVTPTPPRLCHSTSLDVCPKMEPQP